MAGVLVTLLLIACDDSTDEVTPSPTRTSAVAITPSPTPTTLPAEYSFPAGAEPAAVTRIIDGDTIEVEIEGQLYTVRYIGIDTPETVDPRRPVECYGKQASAYNELLVGGLIVGLEKDVSETDQFGRLLRYVWLNQTEMANAVLVRDGYADASAYPPDVLYQQLFEGLEADARAAGRGLWGDVCLETPSPTPDGTPAPGACEYSGTAEPIIKGNISTNTDEKIYHVPGGGFYQQTVIDETRGERWFCTEADAVSSGWRKSLS
jgi:micrococcal nuclease